jgi:hypothetical protein
VSELVTSELRWGAAAAMTVGFVTALLLSAFGAGGLRTATADLSVAPLPARASQSVTLTGPARLASVRVPAIRVPERRRSFDSSR